LIDRFLIHSFSYSYIRGNDADAITLYVGNVSNAVIYNYSYCKLCTYTAYL